MTIHFSNNLSTMLFIATAALLISQVAGNGLANPKELSFEELRSLKVVKNNSTAAPTQYLITSMYNDKDSCSGNAYMSMGVGFGTCMGGSGYSVSYTAPSQDSTSIKYTYNYYASDDCTGPSTFSIPASYSLICYPSSLYGIKYSLGSASSTSAPWDALGAGVVSQSFTDEKSCSSGGNGNTFSFTPLNICMAVTSTDGTSKSEMFTGCAATVDFTLFSDAECKIKLSDASGPLGKCYKGETDIKTTSCNK